VSLFSRVQIKRLAARPGTAFGPNLHTDFYRVDKYRRDFDVHALKTKTFGSTVASGGARPKPAADHKVLNGAQEKRNSEAGKPVAVILVRIGWHCAKKNVRIFGAVTKSASCRRQSSSERAGRAMPSSSARLGLERASTRIPSRTPSRRRARSRGARPRGMAPSA
jgi:hypothetical protein